MNKQPSPPSDNNKTLDQVIRSKVNAIPQPWAKAITVGFLLFCLSMALFGFYQVVSTYAAQESKSALQELYPLNHLPYDEQ